MARIQNPNIRFLKVDEVATWFGVSRSTIWRWSNGSSEFPQPHKLSNGATRWFVSQLEEYEKNLMINLIGNPDTQKD